MITAFGEALSRFLSAHRRRRIFRQPIGSERKKLILFFSFRFDANDHWTWTWSCSNLEHASMHARADAGRDIIIIASSHPS